MNRWLRLSMERSVRRQALAYAVVVGAILIAINHGDALLRGQMNGVRLLKMALTVVVPYLVSTLSSIGTLRALGQPGDRALEQETRLSSRSQRRTPPRLE
ncbi:MAG: nitrate/nitrite transporter NrtS [Acidobacteriota bacterium]